MVYRVILSEDAKNQFGRLDKSVKLRVSKKLTQMEREDISYRHLGHGLPLYVAEIAGYRASFEQNDEAKTREVLFVGTHKEYENWYQYAFREKHAA